MKPLPEGNRIAAAAGSVSDADLVRAACRGDKQAFVEIVARHQAMVCAVALGITGNFAASEDAAQEAFLTAWRKIGELREPDRLRAWLRQIARHAALAHHRRQHGHDALEETSDLPDLAPGPDEHVASEEEAALVRTALTQLPDLYREPLILYYRENQSTKAVAQALDLSEEAVRQRLARGRELLREQVSAVIETVLTRTRPTAVFTLAVAAAIGAMASPAAIAGGVFSAAGTAAASSTTPSSFLHALSASKAFLFLAAVACFLCVPIGYHLQVGLKPPPSELDEAAIAENTLRPPVTARLAPERSAIFAEWKRLHDTHGTNVEAMPAIYREISGFNDTLRRQGFRAALIAEWVQLNPTNLMAGFRNRTIEASQRRRFIDEWLAQDAGQAMETLVSTGRGGDVAARSSLLELARHAPGRLTEFVARLPGPDSSSDHYVHDAYLLFAEADVDSARVAAEALSGPNRSQALTGVAQAWGKRELSGALAWTRSLSDGTNRDELIRSTLVGAAATDPVTALEQVGLVASGGKKGSFASTTGARVLRAAVDVDFESAVAWVAARPGRPGDEDLLGLAPALAEKLNADPAGVLTQYSASGVLPALLPALTNALVKESSGQREAVWEWLRGQDEDSTRTVLRQVVLFTVGEQDIGLAFRLADEVFQTKEREVHLSLLADGLLRHGAALHRMEGLLQSAPPGLRQALIRSAFSYLKPETLVDPQRWLGLLSELPEADHPRSAARLARVWAARTPREAIGWVVSMPAGVTRLQAVSAATSSWAAQDAPGAARWIATLPPGPEHDGSTESLVVAIAEEFPRQAWDWAMTIDDVDGRTRAAVQAAKMMTSQEIVVARAWVENGPFTGEAKAALQASFPITQTGRSAP